MPAEEKLNLPAEGEFDLSAAWLKQLGDELDEAEKDVELLSKFSGNRSEHQRLADSIREQQRGAERLVERLRVSDLDTEQQQLRIKQLQRKFRAALLQYRPNTRANAQRERELLLSGAATPAELRKKKARTGNAALNAAADVTTALQETVSMMSDEIEKSVGNVTAMKESSDKLRKTKGQYLVMDDVLKMSKSLVRTLEQADAVDRWLMLCGLVLFSLVAFNILRKRVWIPGLYTVFRIIRYVFTLGLRSGDADAVESLHVSAESVTQQLVHATTTISSAASALTASLTSSEEVTMTLEPILLSADVPQPSVETLDTFATTGISGSTSSSTSTSASASSNSNSNSNIPEQNPDKPSDVISNSSDNKSEK
ncbi:Vesicle transport protein S20, partial [Coemansia erecta]